MATEMQKGVIYIDQDTESSYQNGDVKKNSEDDGPVKRTGTWMTASAHIITAVIGSGVLSLAWAIAQLGWAAGPAVLLAFSFITYFTSSLLVDCYRSPDPVTGKRNYTYMDVVRAFLGTWTASAHIVTAVIGFGVLSLAWATAQLGLAAGPAVLLAFSFITYFTSSLFADCYRSSDPVTGKRNDTYRDVVRANFRSPVAMVVKPLPVLFVLSLLCMAISLPGAHSARLMQSAPDNLYGGSDDSSSVEKEKPEYDAKYLKCWQLAHTPVPTSPTPINDDKKEKEKPEDDAIYSQCWLLAPAPAPTSLAPINDIDDKKVKERLEDDAMHLQCQPFAPTPAPTSSAPINEKEKLKDDAMYLKCWPLAPTPAPASAAHINDNKKDNSKLLFFCGYPCCGFNIHGPCKRCCPNGVLHPSPPMTHV